MTEDTYSGRLEIRLSKADRDAVLEAAEREGVNKSEWCRRVFANVLGTPQVETGPSGDEGSALAKPSGPTPVPSSADAEAGHARASANGEGVRPAAQSQATDEKGAANGLRAHDDRNLNEQDRRQQDPGSQGAGRGSSSRADAEAKPKRISPVKPFHPTVIPRRADVGPKPVSATKPRPKATKPKGKR
jgi:hypothetical protein